MPEETTVDTTAPAVAEPLSTTAEQTMAPVFDFISKQRTEDAPPANTPPADDTAAPVVTPAAPVEKAGDDAPWKKMPIEELLKERGITDTKLLKLITHHQNKGDLSEYFKVFNTDFKDVSDQDLLAMQINQSYADFSDEEKDDLIKAKIDSYKLDSDLYTEEEIRRGKVALKADMKAFREKQIADQAEMIAKEPPAANAQADDAAAIKQYVEALTKHPDYINLESTGTIKIGSGEGAFNMDVDKTKVVAYLADDEVYAKAYQDKNGNTDFSKQLRVAAYAIDPERLS